MTTLQYLLTVVWLQDKHLSVNPQVHMENNRT